MMGDRAIHVAVSCSHDFSPAFGVTRVVRGIESSLIPTRKNAKLTFYGVSADAYRELGAHTSASGVQFKLGPRALCFGSYRTLWEQTELPRQCARDGIDLLHVPAYTAPVMTQTPVVVTLHDLLSTTNPEFCRKRNVLHHRLVVPRTLRQARLIFTVSEYVRNEVARCFDLPPSKVVTIHPGIAAEFLRPIEPDARQRVQQRYHLPAKYLLWVGNREPKKNLTRLLEAMRLLKSAGLNIPLVMTGTATSSDGRASDVRDVGWVEPQDLAPLYAGAESLVFPSLAEGWGFPVAEAMAIGIPTVASQVPAAMEIDPTAVSLVRAESAESIACGVARVLQDSALRRTLARRGRQAASHFTWERHAARLWAGYEQALTIDERQSQIRYLEQVKHSPPPKSAGVLTRFLASSRT